MLFFLYCSVNTLKISQAEFDNIIKTNAHSSIKIDDNSWIVKINKTDYASFEYEETDFYDTAIAPFANDDSIVAIVGITNRFDANLPQAVLDFISEEQ